MSTISKATNSTLAPTVQISGMFSHPLSTKLDDNFFQWCQQALAPIKGNKMLFYVKHKDAIPVEFLFEADKIKGVINSAYITWVQRDQILMFWLLEAATPIVQAQMVGCDTAYQVWDRIERLFFSQSQARTMQYKLQLQTIKKGGLTMAEYVLQIKSIIDVIAFTSHIISEDLILHILSDIGVEYDAFVVSLTTQIEPTKLPDMRSMLLAQEHRIDQHKAVTDDTTSNKNISPNKLSSSNGNNMQCQRTSQYGGCVSYRGDNASTNYGGLGCYRGCGRGYKGFRNNQSNKRFCQLCHKPGHIALNYCSYQGQTNTTPNTMTVMDALPNSLIDPN